ncbi:MAG: tripartite tricarboxylate transporter substrate binding protein [Rubrivivax sp.]
MQFNPTKHTARHRRALLMLGAAALALSAVGHTPSARAADDVYPTRPIKLVVGYSPGGTTDIIARLIAPGMGAALGQTVVIENRPGAGGNLGAELTVNAPPDGYTLLMGTAGNMTVNPWIYAGMRFDPVRDLAPISLVAAVPNVMVVNPAVPAKTVAEFIAWAKMRPGQVFFASSGNGNTPHVTGELFNLRAGLKMIHVPYKGSGPALQDLIAGQGVHVMFDNLPSAIGHIKSGLLRALATTAATRSPAAPELPTMQEEGFKDFDVQGWFGVLAPAKTPAAIVDKLHAAVLKALADPATRKSLDELGAVVVGNAPAEFDRRIKAESKSWSEVVKAAGIELR